MEDRPDGHPDEDRLNGYPDEDRPNGQPDEDCPNGHPDDLQKICFYRSSGRTVAVLKPYMVVSEKCSWMVDNEEVASGVAIDLHMTIALMKNKMTAFTYTQSRHNLRSARPNIFCIVQVAADSHK